MKKWPILIIGGGNAGISVAAQLLLKDKSLQIAIVDPSDKHYYQPAWTLVGGGAFEAQDTVREQASVMPKGVEWIKAACAEFLPDENQVRLDNGETLAYDYLIVAPGIQLDWHKIEGLKPEDIGRNGITSNYLFHTAPYTYECLQAVKEGQRFLFTNPNTPIKCGGAPQKIMYLAGDYLLKKGLKDKASVEFYSAGGVIFGIKKYADTLNQVIERYGIKTHYKNNLVAIDPAKKIATFERPNAEGQMERVEEAYDYIHIVPPQSAPDFIKRSPLALADNPLGWMDVDKHSLQHKRYPNIFGIGDATSTPNAKTGAAVRKQAPVLVANLLALMQTGQVTSEQYKGYGSCPLVTGYGKLVLAEFDYDNQPQESFFFDQGQERWSMWLLKKHVLPWLYWNKILSGKA